MSQAVKRLISRQEALKKSITAAASDFASRGDSAQSESEARADLEQLGSWWLKFEANHESIVDYNAEGKLDEHSYFVNDLYQETCRAHRSFKGALLHKLKASTNNSATATASSASHDSTQHQGSLPTLQLPKFSGRYEEWRSFHDRFQSIVGQNARLAPVVKLQYLIGCLSGDALTLIANIPLQDDNYENALERLRARFENKRVIINAHFDVLFALKPANRKCAKSLELVRSTVSNVCDALELLGGHPAEWDYFLVYFVTKKLDADTQEAWELSLGTSTEPPTYKSLDEFLVSRVRALESLGNRASSATAKPQSASQPNQPQSRGARVHAATRSAPALPPFPCCLCSGQHFLHLCEKYQEMSPKQRYTFLEEQHRCLNCFATHHSVKNCRSSKRCFTCSKLHHTSIHEHCVGSELNPAAGTFYPRRGEPTTSATSPTSSSQPAQALSSI